MTINASESDTELVPVIVPELETELTIQEQIMLLSVQQEDAIWYDADLQFVGTFIYVGSASNYTPVSTLTGVHGVEMSNLAENNLIKEPYLTSCSQDQLKGVVDDGYDCYFNYGSYLCVTQPHYTGVNNNTRDAVAYYRVEIQRIDTNLLYRPQRTEYLMPVILGGCFVISIYTILKWVRR